MKNANVLLCCLALALTLATSYADDVKPVKPHPKSKPKPTKPSVGEDDEVCPDYSLDSGNINTGFLWAFGFDTTPIYGQLISPGEGSISGFTMDVIVDPQEILVGLMYEMNVSTFYTGSALYESSPTATISKAQETLTFTFDSPVSTTANTVYVLAIQSIGLSGAIPDTAKYSRFPVTSGDGIVWANNDIAENPWDGDNWLGVSSIHTYDFTGCALPECFCSTCENTNDDAFYADYATSYYAEGGDREQVCTDLSTLDVEIISSYCSLPDGECSSAYAADSNNTQLWVGAVGAIALVAVAAVLTVQIVSRKKAAVESGTGPSRHGLMMEESTHHIPDVDVEVQLEMYSGMPKRAPLVL